LKADKNPLGSVSGARRVLFATPEVAPLNKVGGLGDVSHGLVQALRRDSWDVRLLVPGYPAVKAAIDHPETLLTLTDHAGRQGYLLQGRASGIDAPLYVVDMPHHFQAQDSPYGDDESSVDCARRFAAFSNAALQIARGMVEDWRPDVIHGNDWTCGLIPALLQRERVRPATVFTVHNLAHQGLFPRGCFDDLRLPDQFWSMDGLEFHGQMSFIKGGLAFADRINTVSPTYADEILTPKFGCGLDGLLHYRRERLSGILNGTDHQTWDPAGDVHLPGRFSADDLEGKAVCKAHLQRRLELEVSVATPLIAMVSRLTHQKGIDLVIDAWQEILGLGAQIVVLGTGDPSFESALVGLSSAHPGRCAVSLCYDEQLAHQIIAGADLFLMPSRFEPCGLTQLYSLRYGTVPVAARTGGLIDTVVDTDSGSLAEDRASGFLFGSGAASEICRTLARALQHYRSPDWLRIQQAGMRQDSGWGQRARHYGTLYRHALSDRSGDLQPSSNPDEHQPFAR
jgi:starch synthase